MLMNQKDSLISEVNGTLPGTFSAPLFKTYVIGKWPLYANVAGGHWALISIQERDS